VSAHEAEFAVEMGRVRGIANTNWRLKMASWKRVVIVRFTPRILWSSLNGRSAGA
jgi:hypothetical protein